MKTLFILALFALAGCSYAAPVSDLEAAIERFHSRWSTTCRHGDCSASYENGDDDDDDGNSAAIEALLQNIAQAENYDAKALLQAFANIERKKHKFSFGKAFKKAKSIGKKALDVGKKTLQTGLKAYNTYNALTNPAVAPAPPVVETPAELEVLLNALLAKRR